MNNTDQTTPTPETPTPLTDAKTHAHTYEDGIHCIEPQPSGLWVPADFARTLERENVRLVAELATLKLRFAAFESGASDFRAQIAVKDAALAESKAECERVVAERDHLKEQANAWMLVHGACYDLPGYAESRQPDVPLSGQDHVVGFIRKTHRDLTDLRAQLATAQQELAEARKKQPVELPAQTMGDGTSGGSLSVFARGWNGCIQTIRKLNPSLVFHEGCLDESRQFHGNIGLLDRTLASLTAVEAKLTQAKAELARVQEENNKYTAAVIEITALKAELAALRADKERLAEDYTKATVTIGHWDLTYHALVSSVRSLLVTRRKLTNSQDAVLVNQLDELAARTKESTPAWPVRAAIDSARAIKGEDAT